MRQKQVSAGQKISGNLSAAAINALPRLIENDQMRELNKPGSTIPIGDIPGHVIYGDRRGRPTLAYGEWTYLDRPLFPAAGIAVNEAAWFFQTEGQETATPNALGSDSGGQWVKNLLPAMHVGNNMFQVSGVARTRLQFPAGVTPSSNIYRTAVIKSNDTIPTATDTDGGVLDIIWHKEIDAVNRIHAAIVRFPAGPRPPRVVQYRSRCSGLTYSATSGVATSLWTREAGPAIASYSGIEQNPATPDKLKFLRGGDYRITLGIYMSSFSWTDKPSRTGAVVAWLTGGSWPGAFACHTNLKNHEGLSGTPTNHILSSFTRVVPIQASDEIGVMAKADVGTAEVYSQVVIEGPFNNHYPEGSAYY